MSSELSTKNTPSDSSTPSDIKHAPLDKRLVARVLYEATLQDLLQARNYATFQLLCERNDLADER